MKKQTENNFIDANPDKKLRLDNPKRLEEYKISDILAVMGLKKGQTGADIGCGTGLFSLPVAKELGKGKLFAVDINQDYLDFLDEKIKSGGVINIETVNARKVNDRILAGSLDFILMCVVLHEIDDKTEFLRYYASKLKEGGKIFIVEFLSSKRSLSDTSGSKKLFLAPCDAESLVIKSGYKDISSKEINELVYILSAKK